MEYVEVFPPGYHFNPTDDELIVHYLKKKTMNEPIPYSKIPEVNIYQYNPQQLSEIFPPLEENILYFFTPRDRKFQRSNGNWKATAKDKSVCYNGEVVGFKKVLVFYEGNSKTNWIMYEYALKEHNPKRNSTNNMRMDDWVLCRIHNRDDKSLKSQNRQVVASVPNENYIQSSPQSIDIGGLFSNGLINDCEDCVQPPSEYVLNEDPPQNIGIGGLFSNGLINNCEDRVLPHSEYVPNEDPQRIDIGGLFSNGLINNCEDRVLPHSEYVLNEDPRRIDIGGLFSNGLINNCEDRVLPPCEYVLNEDLQHRLDHLQANVQFNDNFLLSGFHDVEENPFTNNYLNEELVQEADDHQVKRLKTTNCDVSNVDGFDDFCKNLETLLSDEEELALN
ncbi:hypothetical protein ACJIZ3_009057 [Penstemon smallii]|uniref:NAC domain-containing protein n=1 Tax=Penstemon smallii TaxID=265156 RepID=A0ABD3TBH1_9LAMI